MMRSLLLPLQLSLASRCFVPLCTHLGLSGFRLLRFLPSVSSGLILVASLFLRTPPLLSLLLGPILPHAILLSLVR